MNFHKRSKIKNPNVGKFSRVQWILNNLKMQIVKNQKENINKTENKDSLELEKNYQIIKKHDKMLKNLN